MAYYRPQYPPGVIHSMQPQPIPQFDLVRPAIPATPKPPAHPGCDCDCHHEESEDHPRGCIHRFKFHSHISILKTLITPFVAVVCLVLGQYTQRLRSPQLQQEYQADILGSILAAFLGGMCLTAPAIWLHLCFDINVHRTKPLRYYATLPSILIIGLCGIFAAPIGVNLISITSGPNERVLDADHALHASGLGGALLMGTVLISKFIALMNDRRRRWIRTQYGYTEIGHPVTYSIVGAASASWCCSTGKDGFWHIDCDDICDCLKCRCCQGSCGNGGLCICDCMSCPSCDCDCNC